MKYDPWGQATTVFFDGPVLVKVADASRAEILTALERIQRALEEATRLPPQPPTPAEPPHE